METLPYFDASGNIDTTATHPPQYFHNDCSISGTAAVCTEWFSLGGSTASSALLTIVTLPVSRIPVQVADATATITNGAGRLTAVAGSVLAVVLGAAAILVI